MMSYSSWSAERPKTVAIERFSAGAKVTHHYRYCDLFKYSFIDIEENGVRLRLTTLDAPGFGDFANGGGGGLWVVGS